MNKEALAAGQELKEAFLRQAIKEGVYLQRPKNTSPDEWSKQRKIGFGYAFQDITLEELGRRYGGTPENSRALNHKFLDNIHRNSPPELQAQYPREAIPDRKPLGQKFRERNSEAHGGSSLRVKEVIQKGIINPIQIKDMLELSTPKLVRRRKVLQGWGIDVSRIRK